MLCCFFREITMNKGYAPVAFDKSHGRIIWDCAWSAEGGLFATASRDKTVRSNDYCSETTYLIFHVGQTLATSR